MKQLHRMAYLFTLLVLSMLGGWKMKMMINARGRSERIPAVPTTKIDKQWTFQDDVDYDISSIPDVDTKKKKSINTIKREKMIVGQWKLDARYSLFQSNYTMYQGTQKGVLTLSNNVFSLTISDVNFSGEFEVVAPVQFLDTPRYLGNSDVFILHAMDVSSDIALGHKPHIFYQVEVRKNKMVLSVLGSSISKIAPPEEVLHFSR